MLSLVIGIGTWVVVGACIAAILVCFWALRCNEKTLTERRQKLNEANEEASRRIAAGQPWMDAYAAFDAVSYDDHFRAVLWGKDRQKMYEGK